jgi:predicted patatin/cPLA2 family phospholipase
VTACSSLLRGWEPESVLAAIRARAAAGDRSDGRKLALVIEGGAMRGVTSGGGAVALAHMGMTDAFDEVFATSAGVMTGAYLLSRQPLLGITVYYDCLASLRFVNPLRLWRILDVDYVFDRVLTVEKPLDVERIRAAGSRFFVSAMDLDSGEGALLDVQDPRVPVLTTLKAATSIPVLYNKSVRIDDRRYVDGGLITPFPLLQAIERGATDVLVLLSRCEGYRRPVPNLATRILFDALTARGNARLRQAFREQQAVDDAVRTIALGRAPAPPGVRIATLCVRPPERVGRVSTDPRVLREVALEYGRATLELFGAPTAGFDLPRIGARPGTDGVRTRVR